MLYDNLGINEYGHLTFCDLDTAELAKEFGTPLYVMDEGRIRARCQEYKKAMAVFLPQGSRPLFASKALSFQGIYRIMASEDMGIDVVSVGEIHTAAAAGFPMENAFFHGNSKTDEAIAYAMDQNVGWFVCDNEWELTAIDQQAQKRGIFQKVLLRLTPGIDPHTHGKINTGRVDSKFGAAIETGQAEALTCKALSKKNIALMGYHCHIGSQIFEETPFVDAAEIMLKFSANMAKTHGFAPKFLNLGGGMAVPYKDTDPKIDYGENIRRIGLVIEKTCKALGLTPPTILMEPGRSIVADSGITLYTATGTKTIPEFRSYVAVDGGMTDNPRYTLYEAPYTVLPASRMNDRAEDTYTVAGCCCESGDILQENVPLPKMERGDLLAVLTTGAYNYAMASNYNRVPRAPIVMVGEDGPKVVVRRETLDDLLKYEA